MISMTKYWEQFKECIDNLQMSTEDEEYSSQIATANDLIEMGLTIEELGLTEIKGITNELTEKSKQFGPAVTYVADQEYILHLPKIRTTGNLIFSILYYQHLVNYQNVSYQGSIYWFRQMVINGVEEKKASMIHRAKAMLDAIHQYCKSQNITVDETLFLKNENESGKEYSTRISMMFHKPPTPSNTQPSVEAREENPMSPTMHQDSSSLLVQRLSPPIDEANLSSELETLSQSTQIVTLELSLVQLNNKWQALKIKTDAIAQKLSIFEQAKQNHLILTNEWQNQSFIVRAFYWFVSLFFEVTLIKNIKSAEEQLLQAENELNQLVPQYTPESYNAKLKQQQKVLKQEQISIQGELKQLKELQKAQQIEEMRKVAELVTPKVEPKLEARQDNTSSHIEALPETSTTRSPEEALLTTSHEGSSFKTRDTLSQEETSSNEESPDIDYYAFFKSYIPSRHVLQAAVVAAGAIAVQNLM